MNTNELNKVLSDEINKLRSGKAKPERTVAVTKAAAQIIAAARLELAYIKMVGVPRSALPFFNQYSSARVIQAPKKNGKS
jgi:hypothetical protein